MMKPASAKQLLVPGIQHRADLIPLTGDEVRFEIDMCIGCDRCMRACPVPLSATVNIADLNLATISDEIAPHVAKFTRECVMCGSCVPVCPVSAVFALDDLPEKWQSFTPRNAAYYGR